MRLGYRGGGRDPHLRAQVAGISTALRRCRLGWYMHQRIGVWRPSLDVDHLRLICLVRPAGIILGHHGNRDLPIAGLGRYLMRLRLPWQRPFDHTVVLVGLHLLFVLEKILGAQLPLFTKRAASRHFVLRVISFDPAAYDAILLLFELLRTGHSIGGGGSVGELYFGRLWRTSGPRSSFRPEVGLYRFEPGAPLGKRLPEVGSLPLKLVECTVGAIRNAY